MALIAVCLWAGQLHSGSGEASARPVSVPERNRAWVEVEDPDGFYRVRGFLSPPLFSEVIPGSGRAGEKRLENGARITVLSAAPPVFRQEKMPGSHLLLFGQKIDVNRAGRRDLEAIPGIGAVLSGRIIRYREEHGDFRELSCLLEIRGIGPKSLSKIEEYLTIKSND